MSDVIFVSEQCQCPCHTSEAKIIHCFPCCEPCPICHKHIISYGWEAHTSRHEQEDMEIENLLWGLTPPPKK